MYRIYKLFIFIYFIKVSICNFYKSRVCNTEKTDSPVRLNLTLKYYRLLKIPHQHPLHISRNSKRRIKYLLVQITQHFIVPQQKIPHLLIVVSQ